MISVRASKGFYKYDQLKLNCCWCKKWFKWISAVFILHTVAYRTHYRHWIHREAVTAICELNCSDLKVHRDSVWRKAKQQTQRPDNQSSASPKVKGRKPLCVLALIKQFVIYSSVNNEPIIHTLSSQSYLILKLLHFNSWTHWYFRLTAPFN